MCIYKNCPIYDVCEKDVDQVLYCRHVEMIKKIGQMRHELKKKQALASLTPLPIVPESEPAKTFSELSPLQRDSEERH